MKIFTALPVLIMMMITSSCSQMKSTTATTKQSGGSSATNDSQIYFKASGNEPFWGLTISEDEIILKTMEDTLIVPHQSPVITKDNHVKLYNIKTNAIDLTIQITQMECVDDMSGEKSPYTVSIDYNRKEALTTQKIKGCGKYITDYRLHDIWVLEMLNGKKMDKSSFRNEMPSIEIDAAANTFMGFTGCNRMSGEIYFEKETLRFKKTIATMMYCGDDNKDGEFLSALNSARNYKIENNRLFLSNASKELIVFLKVD